MLVDIIQQIIDNEDMESISKLRLKVDGNYFNDYTQFMNDEIMVIPHECVIKGDDKVKAISAASILAKVDRDLYIEDICKTHPDLDEKYDLVKNKGYGTKKHREGIQQFGYSEFHRKSFKLKSLNVPRNLCSTHQTFFRFFWFIAILLFGRCFKFGFNRKLLRLMFCLAS